MALSRSKQLSANNRMCRTCMYVDAAGGIADTGTAAGTFVTPPVLLRRLSALLLRRLSRILSLWTCAWLLGTRLRHLHRSEATPFLVVTGTFARPGSGPATSSTMAVSMYAMPPIGKRPTGASVAPLAPRIGNEKP